jgi:hypothetical protein
MVAGVKRRRSSPEMFERKSVAAGIDGGLSVS